MYVCVCVCVCVCMCVVCVGGGAHHRWRWKVKEFVNRKLIFDTKVGHTANTSISYLQV